MSVKDELKYRFTDLYGSKKITIALYLGLAISVTALGATIVSDHLTISEEHTHYLSLNEIEGEQYILDGMSCTTLLASVHLDKSDTPKPKIIDGECWDYCNQLEEGFVPEPNHYFFHINDDTGYKYFNGLDERVQECRI